MLDNKFLIMSVGRTRLLSEKAHFCMEEQGGSKLPSGLCHNVEVPILAGLRGHFHNVTCQIVFEEQTLNVLLPENQFLEAAVISVLCQEPNGL